MTKFTVTLHEEPDDKFTIFFFCQADDPDHAEEQALNAYPKGQIINIMEN